MQWISRRRARRLQDPCRKETWGSQRMVARSQQRLSFEFLEARLVLSTTWGMVQPLDGSREVRAEYASDRILIGLRDASNSAVLEDALPGASPSRLSVADARLYSVGLPIGVDVAQAVATYQANPAVLFAEPDYVVYPSLIPNDPSFPQLWGMHNTGQVGGKVDADIDAPEGWNLATGSGNVVIAVIDSGTDYNHPDLASNIWVNSGEIPGNNIDDDGNGYIDDVHGYDFFSEDGNPLPTDVHGTHVAGTIGAVANNSVGVAGVIHRAQMMILRFLGPTGSTSNAIRAVDYAVAMGAKLSNNSWGGGPYSAALELSIQNARAANHIFIAAAGNDSLNNDSHPHFPASYELDNIVSVAATTRTDTLASFSNYGAYSVDLGAPGHEIYSTLPGNSYGNLNGTSMAAPHVAGAVALLLDMNPGISYAAAIHRLFESTDPVPALYGKTTTGGRLNLDKLLRGVDRMGPMVTGIETPGADAASFQEILVTFNESINPTTFAKADVNLAGPGGNVAIANVTAVAGTSDKTFRIQTTAIQTRMGNYALRVGPSINDLAGNKMNQDRDGTNGEGVADRFTTVIRNALLPSFSATDLPKPIPDLTTTISRITVANGFLITDLDVQIDIRHTWVEDLDIVLRAPNGQQIILSSDNGGAGDNYEKTVFDDEAAIPITAAAAPFRGSYRPEEPLSLFDGMNSQGVWELRVFDDTFFDPGDLLAFKLIFETPIGPVVEQYTISTGADGKITNSNGTTLTVDDSDIVRVNIDAQRRVFYQMVFDGSDVGLTTPSEDVDAFAVMNDGSFLISTTGAYSVPGPGGTTISGGGEDILRFIPTTLGTTTAGTWQMYFHGSDVGLSGSAESIDALAIVPGGLVISTFGAMNVPGLTATDRDLVLFTIGTTGNVTTGTWSMFLPGTELALTTASEDIDGLYLEFPTTSQMRLRLSTLGNFSVPGLTGKGTDMATATTSNPPGGAIAFENPVTINGALMGLKTIGIDGIDGRAITMPLTMEPPGGVDPEVPAYHWDDFLDDPLGWLRPGSSPGIPEVDGAFASFVDLDGMSLVPPQGLALIPGVGRVRPAEPFVSARNVARASLVASETVRDDTWRFQESESGPSMNPFAK